jgi:predicted ribosome quality control (RQC) complex YloA/Tae2 family protein
MVEQIGFDRILRLNLVLPTERFKLVFELFGPGANVYLLDSRDRVITSLRRTHDIQTYEPPDQPGGMPPYDATPDGIKSAVSADPTRSVRESVEATIRGCDASFWDLALRDIDDSEAVGNISHSQLNAMAKSILDTYSECVSRRRRVVLADGGISWIGSHADGHAYMLLNDAIADAAHELSYNTAVKSIRQRISRGLKRERMRLTGKLERLEALLADAGDARRYREWAELLTLNIKRIRKGMTSVTVVNLYDETQAEIAIPLQKDLSPPANIDKLFRRYRKLVDSVASSERQIPGIKSELEALQQHKTQLENATDLTELIKLERSLTKDGLLKPAKKPPSSHRVRPGERFRPRVFHTSAGEEILVGRNSRENEYVTFKVAKKHDIWFHSQQTPGSHVVLRLKEKGKAPTHESIVEAAQAAAHFSQARTSSKVPVIYSEVRHLQKIRGGPPGKVRCTRVKSIMVEPKHPD